MGILDQVTDKLGGGKGGGIQAVLLQQLVGYLSKPGALGNLAQSFQSNGLGNVLQSWIGTGQNLPISASQVQQVLGNDVVSDMAGKAGLDVPETADALSGMLPQVVDKLSPDGKEPSSNQLGGLLSSVGKMFG